jgi:hypothetical protein
LVLPEYFHLHDPFDNDVMRGCIRYCLPVLLINLFGCSPHSISFKEINAIAPKRVELLDVPFVPSDENECGPASLKMLLSCHGEEIEMDTLRSMLMTPEKGGTLQVDMMAGVRRFGYVPYLLDPFISSILMEVASENPVVVFQNRGLRWFPLWHYAVVVGYDVQKEEIYLRSGKDKKETLSFTSFNTFWERADRWAFVVPEKEGIPYTANETRFLEAVHALEKTGKLEDALKYYRNASRHWSSNTAFKMASANVLLQLGRTEESITVLEEVLEIDPDYVPALNNLALIYHTEGHLEFACALATKAAKNDSPFRKSALRTLEKIEQDMSGGACAE